MQNIHNGHQGIVRCIQRISSAVWWPGVSSQIENYIKKCPVCLKMTPNPKEPLMSARLPQYPWQKIAADLCELKGKSYLVIVDNFSRYIEVQSLSSTTSANIISSLKSIFSRHGIPQTLISQWSSVYFKGNVPICKSIWVHTGH